MTDTKAPQSSRPTADTEAERLLARQKELAEAQRLKERRKADAEARRRIEQANREAEERFRAYEERQAALRAAERAEEEEREAEKLAKAAERKAALAEKAALKKAALEEKAAAREALEKEKAAAASEKQSLKAQQAEEKSKLQALKAKLKEELRAQTKEHGAPFAELLDAFIKVFSQRSDVRVGESELAAPLAMEELLKVQDLPADALCLYHLSGAPSLSWGFQDEDRVVAKFAVPPIDLLGQMEDPKAALVPSKAQIERAFIDPLKQADWERLLADSALPWSTTGCLVDALIKKGLEEKTAKTLVLWLGESARILVHRLDTEEAKRRNELMKNIASDGKLNRKLIEAMNNGPSLDKAQWERLLARHQSFLEGGGAGGQFLLEVQNGLPVLSYTGAPDVLGQALLVCENLSGVRFDGANLSFAGMAGIRAENASFAKADLSSANFSYATLNGAKFTSAKLAECDFTGSKLAGANFRGADLTGSNFELADLTGANFAGAITKNTRFGGAMVRGVKY